jgi:hypothetical protein
MRKTGDNIIMKPNKNTFANALCFIVLIFITMACDTDQGMMHGNGSPGMSGWNYGPVLIGLVVGALLGFLIWQVISRRKR